MTCDVVVLVERSFALEAALTPDDSKSRSDHNTSIFDCTHMDIRHHCISRVGCTVPSGQTYQFDSSVEIYTKRLLLKAKYMQRI